MVSFLLWGQRKIWMALTYSKAQSWDSFKDGWIAGNWQVIIVYDFFKKHIIYLHGL